MKRFSAAFSAFSIFLAAVLLIGSPQASAAAFADTAGSPYAEAIALLAQAGIVGGDGTGNYNPDGQVTRAEFSKILCLLYGGAPFETHGFSDVSAEAWFSGYVGWAAKNGIVGGRGDGWFDPGAPVKLTEAIKMLVVAATGDNTLSWPDGYIDKAGELGLLKNISGEAYDFPASRGAAAQLAANALPLPSPLLMGGFPGELHIKKLAVKLTDYADKVSRGDWAPAFAAAFAAGDVIYIPAGRYSLSKVVVPSGKTIFGDGKKTVLTPLDSIMFHVLGSYSGEYALEKDMEDFSNTFTLKSAPSLKEGDLIYILGQRNSQILQDSGRDWCLGRSYAKGTTSFFGEFLSVASADGKTVTTEENTIFPYYYASGEKESDPKKPTSGGADWPYRRAATTIRKITPVSGVTMRDFNVEANSGTIIYTRWARDCYFENIHLKTSETVPAVQGMYFIRFSESLDCEARNCSYVIRGGLEIKPEDGMSVYSKYKLFCVLSSTNCGFVFCYADGGTHCFMMSKEDKKGPNIGGYFIGCTAKNAIWSGFYTAQGCYLSTVSRCTVRSCGTGISAAGRANIIEGNYIDLSLPFSTNYVYVRTAEGGTSGIMLNEGYSIDSVIRNNTIQNACSGILIRDGYEGDNIFEFGKITVEKNLIADCVSGLFVWKNAQNPGSTMEIVLSGNAFKRCGAEKGGLTAFHKIIYR